VFAEHGIVKTPHHRGVLFGAFRLSRLMLAAGVLSAVLSLI
jgi:hypothetical protein